MFSYQQPGIAYGTVRADVRRQPDVVVPRSAFEMESEVGRSAQRRERISLDVYESAVNPFRSSGMARKPAETFSGPMLGGKKKAVLGLVCLFFFSAAAVARAARFPHSQYCVFAAAPPQAVAAALAPLPTVPTRPTVASRHVTTLCVCCCGVAGHAPAICRPAAGVGGHEERCHSGASTSDGLALASAPDSSRCPAACKPTQHRGALRSAAPVVPAAALQPTARSRHAPPAVFPARPASAQLSPPAALLSDVGRCCTRTTATTPGSTKKARCLSVRTSVTASGGGGGGVGGRGAW